MPIEKLTVQDVPSNRPGHRVLRMTGQLTLESLFSFQQAVRAEKAPVLILDMTGVNFIDSAGVGAMVGAAVTTQKDGRKLALVGVGERASASLSILGLTKFFPTFDTVDAAEKSFA